MYHVIINPSNEIITTAIYNFLTEKGFKLFQPLGRYLSGSHFSIDFDAKKVLHCSGSKHYFNSLTDHTIITIDDLIVRDFSFPITLKLNDNYRAVISKAGIQIGCQTFSFEKLDELTEAVKKVRES